MKKYQNTIAAALTLMSFTSFAQGGWINNGAVVHIGNSTTVRVSNGGVTNQNNGSIQNEGALHLDRDWEQTGSATQYAGEGWLQFDGNGIQQVSSNNALTVANLRVNNGDRLVLNETVNIDQNLDLSHNGSIELGNSHLVLAKGATIANYDNQHYIITNALGQLEQHVGTDEVVFPVGNASYNPARMSNAGTPDHLQVRVEDRVWEAGTNGALATENAVDRTWHIDERIAGGTDANLTVQWDAKQELSGFNRDQALVSNWTGAWEADEAAALPTQQKNGHEFAQKRTGITELAPFVVRSKSGVATPVEATTAQTANMTLFPNPAHELLNVRLEVADATTSTIRIFAANGQVLYERAYALSADAAVTISDMSHLPSGTYILQAITDNGQILSQPFIKTRP